MLRSVWLKTTIGIILSISIAFYVNALLKTTTEQIEVLVAARDIPEQTVIDSSMLKKIRVNAAAQHVLVPQAVRSLEDLVGAITLVPFRSGEVIVRDVTKIALLDEQSHKEHLRLVSDLPQSYFIPSDKRATTVRVDAEGSLAFSLKKGDVVDILFTSMGHETSGIYSTIIIEKVTIFELDHISERDRSNANTAMQNITLLVTPKEAEMLALAKRKGKIDLLLNPLNIDEQTKKPSEPTYSRDFIN